MTLRLWCFLWLRLFIRRGVSLVHILLSSVQENYRRLLYSKHLRTHQYGDVKVDFWKCRENKPSLYNYPDRLFEMIKPDLWLIHHQPYLRFMVLFFLTSIKQLRLVCWCLSSQIAIWLTLNWQLRILMYFSDAYLPSDGEWHLNI